MYDIILDPVEFFAETKNRTNPAYMEAFEKIRGTSPGALGRIKRLVTAIKKKYKNQDNDIVGSKGNILAYKYHDSIEKAFQILKKYHANSPVVQSLEKIHKALHTNRVVYEDGYKKYVDLITIEYEMALTTLVNGLEYQLASALEIEERRGTFIISKKSGKGNTTLDKMIISLASEISEHSHVQFMTALVKAKEEYKVNTSVNESTNFEESTVSEIVDLIRELPRSGEGLFRSVVGGFKTLIKSAFGILIIIRACTYYWYQRKANKIISLQEQIHFIELNIEQLQNMKSMDPVKKEEVIKKQRAVIEIYRKKSDKLLAQLQDTSRDTSTSLKQDEVEIKKDDPEDEFQL